MEMNAVSALLHTISQALTVPVIVVLICLMVYAVCAIGAVIVEYVAERRLFRANGPALVRAVEQATPASFERTIKEGGLLADQSAAVLSIWEARDMAPEAMWSFAKGQLKRVSRKDTAGVVRIETVGKIAPMLGLLGTLIPLGPGIVALSTGDTAMLANALLIAFDTTVAGLVVAVVCTVLARIRRSWYASYNAVMEAVVNTELELIERLAGKGNLGIDARTQAAGAPSSQSRQVLA